MNGVDYTQKYIRLNIRTNTKIPTLNACKITNDNATNSGNNRGPISGGANSAAANSCSKLWHYCGGNQLYHGGNGEANSVVVNSGSNGGRNGGAKLVGAIIQSKLLPISGGN